MSSITSLSLLMLLNSFFIFSCNVLFAEANQTHRGGSVEVLLRAEKQFQKDIEKIDEYVQQVFLNEMDTAKESNDGHLLARWLEKKDAYEKLRAIDDSPELRILKKEVRIRVGLAISRLEKGYNDALVTAGKSGVFEEVRAVNAEWKQFFSYIDPSKTDGLQSLRHCLLNRDDNRNVGIDREPTLDRWFIERCGVCVEKITVSVRYGATIRTEEIFVAREVPYIQAFQIRQNDQIVSINGNKIDDERIKSPVSFSFSSDDDSSVVVIVREVREDPKQYSLRRSFNNPMEIISPIKSDQEVFWGAVRTLDISVSGKAEKKKP